MSLLSWKALNTSKYSHFWHFCLLLILWRAERRDEQVKVEWLLLQVKTISSIWTLLHCTTLVLNMNKQNTLFSGKPNRLKSLCCPFLLVCVLWYISSRNISVVVENVRLLGLWHCYLTVTHLTEMGSFPTTEVAVCPPPSPGLLNLAWSDICDDSQICSVPMAEPSAFLADAFPSLSGHLLKHGLFKSQGIAASIEACRCS